MASSPARQVPVKIGPWTEEEWLSLPDDGQRHELLEGTLIVSPAPSGRHQGVAGRLHVILDACAPAEMRVVEAMGVRVPGADFVPDVLVVDAAALMADQSGVLDPGAFHLVIEIVSPNSKTMDRLVKPPRYAQADIPNYWRVELEPSVSISVHRLEHGSYSLAFSTPAGERLTVARPFSISFDPADLVR